MVTSLSGAEDQGGRAHYYRKIEYIFENKIKKNLIQDHELNFKCINN